MGSNLEKEFFPNNTVQCNICIQALYNAIQSNIYGIFLNEYLNEYYKYLQQIKDSKYQARFLLEINKKRIKIHSTGYYDSESKYYPEFIIGKKDLIVDINNMEYDLYGNFVKIIFEVPIRCDDNSSTIDTIVRKEYWILSKDHLITKLGADYSVEN